MTEIKGTRNGWMLQPDTTEKDFEAAKELYYPLKCLICNAATSKRFRVGFLGRSIITVNNNLPDNAIYFNSIK